MGLVRYIGYLILLLTGCTSASDNRHNNIPQLDNNVSGSTSVTCEVMYAAHPHKKAIEAVGKSRINQTQTFNFDEMTALSQVFIPTTQAIADDIAQSSGGSLQILEQELVLGGYEGETIPSVVIRTSVHSDAGYAALLRMAAQIAYVYAQDSTLVICADKPVENWHKVTFIDVTDSGREKFFNAQSVPLFFGMMIGAFNRPDNIGYTFYKDSKTFSTLALSRTESEYNSVLENLAVWINRLSNNDVELEVSSNTVWIFFPHNDWSEEPKGESFLRYMKDGVLSSTLTQRRQQYLEDLDAFLMQILMQRESQ